MAPVDVGVPGPVQHNVLVINDAFCDTALPLMMWLALHDSEGQAHAGVPLKQQRKDALDKRA